MGPWADGREPVGLAPPLTSRVKTEIDAGGIERGIKTKGKTMSDPFYCIGIPRIERSAEAAIRRSKVFRDGIKFDKECREKYPELAEKPLDESNRFPFSPKDVGKFLAFLGDTTKEREEKEQLRSAVFTLTCLLDPTQCQISHCNHNHSSYPMNCGEGRNPRVCPKAKDYREKKSADHEECKMCSHRAEPYGHSTKRSFFAGYRCNAKSNAERPENCPKKKA